MPSLTTVRPTPLESRSGLAASESRPRLLLAVMMLSVFLATSNVFIVNVATPAVQSGLQTGFSGIQFVISGYSLAYAVGLIIAGRLGDRFGRKRILFYGVAVFTLASLACGLAPDVNVLIASRIIQGIGAAMIMPQVLSLIQVNYPPDKRGAVFGLYGATQGIAATTGQLIGGLLLWWNPGALDWRSVFFFSVPVGLLILSMIPFIPESKGESNAKLDGIGALLAAGGLLMLVFPLVQGQKSGWPAWLIVCLVLSLPVLAFFAWFENRISRAGGSPFVNVRLFRQRAFSIGMLIALLLFCTQSAYFLVIAYYLQSGLGYTALTAGLVILPMGTGYFLASLLSARAARRFGARVMSFGSVLTVLGYVGVASAASPDGIAVFGYGALFLLGAGQGFIAAPLTNTVLAQIRGSDVGTGSGILATGMQVSYAIGAALIGVVLLNSLNHYAEPASSRAAAQLGQTLAAASVPAEQSEEWQSRFRICYADYVRGSDPRAVPASCAIDAGSNDAAGAWAIGLRQASAINYAHSFRLSLFLLAAFTALLLPLTLMLVRRKSQSTEAGT